MAKVINLTDKFSKEQPAIQIDNEIYEVNDSMETILKFQELAKQGTVEAFGKAFELALGKQVAKKLNLMKRSQDYIRVLVVGIMAAARRMEYDEAEKMFRE